MYKTANNHKTAREAIEAVGLAYDLVKVPVQVNGIEVADAFGVCKSTDGTPLAVVGSRYTPYSNIELARQADDVRTALGVESECRAFAMANERKIAVQVRMPVGFKVTGDPSPHETWLTLLNSHDGSTVLAAVSTVIRVVCQNTFFAALKTTGGYRIRHSLDVNERMSQAMAAIKIANDSVKKFEALAERMAQTAFTDSSLKLALDRLLPGDSTRSKNARDVISGLAGGAGLGIEGPIKGTVWGAYQALTEYADHHKGTRGSSDAAREANRLASVWMGSGQAFKGMALDTLLETVVESTGADLTQGINF